MERICWTDNFFDVEQFNHVLTNLFIIMVNKYVYLFKSYFYLKC